MGAGQAASKIERFADRVDAKLRADELSDATMKVSTRSKVRVVLRSCGFEKRGSTNLQRIEQALEARSVYSHPPLTSSGLDWDGVVHFARTPWTGDGERHFRFPVEHHLNQFLVANFELAFPDLQLVKAEFEVDSGFVDILAKDADHYVVIELKKDVPTPDLVYALGRYMTDVAKWARSRRDKRLVRGVVVSGRVNDRMYAQLKALASAEGLDVSWKTYSVDLCLAEVPS